MLSVSNECLCEIIDMEGKQLKDIIILPFCKMGWQNIIYRHSICWGWMIDKIQYLGYSYSDDVSVISVYGLKWYYDYSGLIIPGYSLSKISSI